MRDLWKIYDDLIASVPDDLVVKEIEVGKSWIAVCSKSVGLAKTIPGCGILPDTEKFIGCKARDIAKLIKSWNFQEAALGLATINSALNVPDEAAKLPGGDATASQSVFQYALQEMAGKKVAVIGHFHKMEDMAKQCKLTVLERNPGPGDIPDSAAEYLLPEQDAIFITSSTLTNKTLPRLLELTPEAKKFIIGPGTPLTSVLFEHGINVLSGALVIDKDKVMQGIREGCCVPGFVNNMKMVNIINQ